MALIQVQAKDLKPGDVGLHDEVIAVTHWGQGRVDVTYKSLMTNRTYTEEQTANEICTILER